MKNHIFVYTGSGNSFYTAKRISQSIADTEISFIAKESLNKNFVISADRVGIVFPVHAFGPPSLVKQFVQQIKQIRCKYFYVLICHGGRPGNTFKLFSKLNNKISVNAYYEILMPGNNITQKRLHDYNKNIDEKLSSADIKINTMILNIKHKVNNTNIKQHYPAAFFSHIVNPLYTLFHEKLVETRDAGFNTNSNCNNCGICKRICPMNNIDVADGKVSWMHSCEMCQACIHWCPQQAIEYKDFTKYRERYRHPKVVSKELFKR